MSNDGVPTAHSNVPPLAKEDHVCPTCRLDYALTSVGEAVERISALPTEVREAVARIPQDRHRWRPAVDGWSAVEYVCHLRDVFVTYTLRLHRACIEDRPSLEPMFNDIRAQRFRYNERDVDAILDELAAAAAGFCDQVASTREQDWNRQVTRLPGEHRTARWLVIQALHEGQHHLHDLDEIAKAKSPGGDRRPRQGKTSGAPGRLPAATHRDWDHGMVTVPRPAVHEDLPGVLDLAAQRREEYAQHQPRFWRPAADARARQAKFFESLLQRSEVGFFVVGASEAPTAFVIASLITAPPVYDPGGLTCMVDDFVVRDPSQWHSVGPSLISAVRAWAAERGASQVVAVTAHHDTEKREALRDAALRIASEWWVGETSGAVEAPPAVERGHAPHFERRVGTD